MANRYRGRGGLGVCQNQQSLEGAPQRIACAAPDGRLLTRPVRHHRIAHKVVADSCAAWDRLNVQECAPQKLALATELPPSMAIKVEKLA